MSDYMYYINEYAITEGNKSLHAGKFQEAEEYFQIALNNLYAYNGDQLFPMMLASELKDNIRLCKWYSRDKAELNSHLGCVLYHIQRFDMEMVYDLLDGHLTYMNYSKDVFIQKLSEVLIAMKKTGDTYLNRISGFDSSKKYQCRKTGFSFVGNKTNMHFDLLFDTTNGQVTDIQESDNFTCDHYCFERQHRIVIYETDYPF
jgi:hypothetical protein